MLRNSRSSTIYSNKTSGRYIQAPRYLQAASKKHVDRRYREDAIEMAVEMVAAGTIAENARYAQIEDQVTQDWETRHKLS